MSESRTIETGVGKEVGAHHGDPTLYERDTKLLADFIKWVQTVRQWREKDRPDWLPSYSDILKSRLFWRIRSGKEPLPNPPPCSYSCPWYEVVEDGVPHDVWPHSTVYFSGESPFEPGEKRVSINQDIYKIIGKEEPGKWLVEHGTYRFRVWEGTCETRYLQDGKVADRESPCWKIQRAPDLEAA